MNILVIDDSPERSWPLKLLGYKVVLAYGRDEIEDAIRMGIQWNMIFLDHDMPGFDGEQVVKEFGSYLINFPIIIWSWNIEGARAMHFQLNKFLRQQNPNVNWDAAERLFNLRRIRRIPYGDWVKTFGT